MIARVCTGHDYRSLGKPRIDWTDPAAKDALVSALVTDANTVVVAFAEAELDEAAAAALALLALVAGQDVEPAEGSDGRDGRWRIARKVAPQRVISTVDPQARHTRKSPSNRTDGYRAHLVAEPETGLITDEQMTMAAGTDNSDAALAQQFLAHTEQDQDEQAAAPSGDGPPGADPDTSASGGDTADHGAADHGAADAEELEDPAAESVAAQSVGQGEGLVWYGDSAYGTGELRGAIERAGHDAVIKPKPVQPAVAGGFTLDDFTVDEGAATVTCPAGQTRPISPARTVTFGGLPAAPPVH